MSDELIGKQLGGYEILNKIGQGGMATVYRAQQISMNRVVAIKVLPRQFLNDDTYLQRFEREVSIITQLEHRNIVPVHDFGHHDGQPYIVMRFMSGGSIDDQLRRGALPLDHVVSLVSQIAPALDYAHSKQVLHRDLKPSNVLLDDTGGAYLTDFGIARILGEQNSPITTQGVVGTPSYMSPEQAQGKPLDARSDIYSLGVMLFEMVCGKRPFEAETPYGTAVLQVTAPPPMPRSFNPVLPGALEQVILKVLHKDANRRYKTAQELAAAIRLAVEKNVFNPLDTAPSGIRRPTPPTDNSREPIAAQNPLPIINPPPAPVPLASAQPVAQPVAQPAPYPLPAQQLAPPPASQIAPQIAPQQYSTGSPAMVGTPPPMSSYQMAVKKRRRRKQDGMWASVLLGGMIGCALLAIVAVAALFVISQLLAPQGTSAVPDSGGSAAVSDSGSTDPAANSATPDIPATEAAARNALLGTPAPAQVATATSAATDAPLPIGARPTSASGTLIYFDNRGGTWDIFRMELTSRVETQLTADGSTNSYPASSPDGERIAFQSNRDGDFDIYVMNHMGGEIRRLVQNEVLDRTPVWSPDGAWILFSSDTRGDDTYDLYRVRADGSDLQLVYSDGTRNTHPAWSAGGLIAFTTGAPDDASTWEIALLNPDSGDLRLLTQNDRPDHSPVFSPDGQRLLFISGSTDAAEIITLDLNSETGSVLYSGRDVWGAHFSPDGGFITFNSFLTGNDEVYVMHADGSDVQRVTLDGGMYPSWLPR